MNDSKVLLQLVQSFFQDYLAGQRGLSPNTILAYRDALKLFLSFLAANTKKPTARLQMVDLHAEHAITVQPRGIFAWQHSEPSSST
jgi:site-specific recombinase XerD